MDEWTLNDLLECSVCLERLDTSSKVLPCQHTFCKKCLDEIVSTHKELRCPECRILVDSTVDGLPPNVLLMRILEGMKNAGNPVPKKKASNFQKPPLVQVSPQQCSTNQSYINIENNKTQPQNLPQNSSQKQSVNNPYARAIYDYISKEVGDLSFKKGELILLHKKVDTQWYQGECGGKVGIFPCSYVQVINPLPNQVATCRALYDFRMVNDEDEGCLSFHKDDVITVIRRVDENWAEGKLNDHIGIFPLAFVEMNSVAQALMKLSISQPGPSRIAPPTPTTEESTPLIPGDHSGVVSNHVVSNSLNQNNTGNIFQQNTTTKSPAPPPVGVPGTDSAVSSSNSTTSSSSITPNSSSNTSSTSNSAPNSPPSNQEIHNQNPFLPTTQPSRQMILQTSHITNSAHGVLPTSHIIGQHFVKGSESFGKPYTSFVPIQAVDFANFNQHPVEKRHSFSAVPASHHNCSNSNKHTAEITGSETGSDNQNGQLVRHGSQRHRRSGSDLTAVNLPAGYVALYPYKPQKADELELKKGGIYFVTERCQDGWFKGTSSKTQKSGVFPGNYVTPAKPLAAVQGQPRAAPAREPTTPAPHKPVHQQKPAKMLQMYGRQLAPPELPPRASSPSGRLTRISVQNSSTSWSSQNEFSNSQKNAEDSPNTSPQTGTNTATVSDPRNTASAAASPVLSPSVSTPSKSADKGKDKKEKSLIKRLTTIKRSKSPPASASYSMDNPVFDDAPAASLQSQSHPHSVHSRSGSCPSQLIQLRAENGSCHRSISASIPTRFKHRERPSVSNANFTHSTSRPLADGTVFVKTVSSAGSSHRKSNSLDAGDTSRKPRQLIPPLRERVRCIVPYPPNSEYELELRVGDIIHVHKKREDGWYKGTLQRTGRTGLFPASFVETY